MAVPFRLFLRTFLSLPLFQCSRFGNVATRSPIQSNPIESHPIRINSPHFLQSFLKTINQSILFNPSFNPSFNPFLDPSFIVVYEHGHRIGCDLCVFAFFFMCAQSGVPGVLPRDDSLGRRPVPSPRADAPLRPSGARQPVPPTDGHVPEGRDQPRARDAPHGDGGQGWHQRRSGLLCLRRWVRRSIRQSIRQCINRSVKQYINPSIHHSIKQSAHQSVT